MSTRVTERMEQPTPTPWWHVDWNGSRYTIKRNGPNTYVGEATTKADAQRIVTAVNAHEGLIAVLREVIDRLESDDIRFHDDFISDLYVALDIAEGRPTHLDMELTKISQPYPKAAVSGSPEDPDGPA